MSTATNKRKVTIHDVNSLARWMEEGNNFFDWPGFQDRELLAEMSELFPDTYIASLLQCHLNSDISDKIRDEMVAHAIGNAMAAINNFDPVLYKQYGCTKEFGASR